MKWLRGFWARTVLLSCAALLSLVWLKSMGFGAGYVHKVRGQRVAVNVADGCFAAGTNEGPWNADSGDGLYWTHQELFRYLFMTERSAYFPIVEVRPRRRYVVIPLWIPIVVLVAVGLPWRSFTRRKNHCVRCGYDLTGVDGPCPECGTES